LKEKHNENSITCAKMLRIKNNILSIFSLCLLVQMLCFGPLEAQTKMMRPYGWRDNLFWGVQVNGGYSMSEFVKDYGIFKSVRPSGDFYFGKYFNPWIGARLDLGYKSQLCAIDPSVVEDPSYNVRMASGFLDGMICINRLFRPAYNPKERYQLVGIVGAGSLYTFGFSDCVKDWETRMPISADKRFSWAARAGLQLQIRISDAAKFTTQALWYFADSKYNGILTSNKPRRFFEFGIGVTVRLFNRYGTHNFDYCRGNEKYYFKEYEDRLLEDHAQQQKKFLKGKAEKPVMVAEQDTVLIFPVGYPYLTKRQEAKLDLVIQYLEENQQNEVTIDLYPIVSDDPKMTPLQSVDRVASVISNYVLKKHEEINPTQLKLVRNYEEKSPISDESIFIHGAIIHFANRVDKKH